jgi:indole-3-glycerol phosphate synthase
MKNNSTILNQIIANKRIEVEELKKTKTYKDFENSNYFNYNCKSLKEKLSSTKFGIIAEFKRKSPSAGIIEDKKDANYYSELYQNLGASAISILTDQTYFGGSIDDVLKVRESTKIPILRKEFIIDEIQIIESKAIGADVILLIAEILTKKEIISFTILAKSLGLEVILELNHPSLIEKIYEEVDVVGINNRNLANQTTSIQTSFDLFQFLPSNKIKISESGIKTREEIIALQELGFNAALIGESILKNTDNLLKFNTLNYAR